MAYQRERWDLYIDHEKGGVRFFEKMLAKLKEAADTRAKDAWNFAMKNDQKSLAGYSGPDDAAYRKMLRREYLEDLRLAEQRVLQLERGRP